MLHICCVRAGTAFSPEYVNILFDSVRRNLADGFEGDFTCFTDQPDILSNGIIVKPLPENLSGWWNKLALWKRGVFPDGDRVLFFDLSNVITGRLDEIAAYNGSFAILRDFYRPDGLQSAIVAWEAGTHTEIWESYKRAGCPTIPGGDQAWIELCIDECDRWQDLFPGLFVSYKQIQGIPAKASVVKFHGKPKPHEVLAGWVLEVWKIGGLSRAELDKVCNTQMDVLLDNVRHSVALDLPWLDTAPPHDGHAVFVGGGPSVKDKIDELKWRKSQGHTIWALNGSAKWLRENDIIPDYHVIVDARPENAEFVRDSVSQTDYLIASQCDRSVFDMLDGQFVKLWHANLEQFGELLKDETERPVHLIGGGSTVGLNALVLAFAMGYRKFHLYGYDSSYQDNDHHAYGQPLNDGQVVIEALCGGRKFKTSPWMAQQATEFEALAQGLINDGCVITVSGDGLLPTLAREMMAEPVITPAEKRAAEILKRIDDIPQPIGAEVGVFAGETSAALLRGNESLCLDMIDSWEGDGAAYIGDSGDFHACLSQEKQDDFYLMALERTAFAANRRNVMKARSIDAAANSFGGYDFVFLDADHSYAGCKADIDAWVSKVTPGGWLCGHDYENEKFPKFGVTQAVNEFVERHGLALELGDNYTWFVRL